MPVHLLAIESSCDETSAAIICDGKIVSNIISTQPQHAKYGGVIPEMASRAHQQNIVHTVNAAIEKARISMKDLNAIAFTQGPGLIGSLMVGCSFAKSIALALNIPLIAVNHMHAHVLAHFIDEPKPQFPFLCLTVSGGHTQIVLAKSFNDIQIVGQTTDDAAGEAYDKSAKLLGFEYPGGPLIDKYSASGNANRFYFPEPKVDGLNFSFSGLKTAVMNFIAEGKMQNENFVTENLNDICASLQWRINSYLINKLSEAAQKFSIQHIALAGGVAANSGLRKLLELSGAIKGWQVFIPSFEYCTDNAAMIALTAWHKYLTNDFAATNIAADARLRF